MTKAQIKKREHCLHSRPIVRRLRWMATELRIKGQLPAVNHLGVRYEVSPKTVTRDMDLLRDFFEYPIAYDPKTYCYKLTGPLPEPVL